MCTVPNSWTLEVVMCFSESYASVRLCVYDPPWTVTVGGNQYHTFTLYLTSKVFFPRFQNPPLNVSQDRTVSNGTFRCRCNGSFELDPCGSDQTIILNSTHHSESMCPHSPSVGYFSIRMTRLHESLHQCLIIVSVVSRVHTVSSFT